MKRLLFVPFIVAGSWLAADTVNALLRRAEVAEPPAAMAAGRPPAVASAELAPGVISRELVEAIRRGDRTDAWAGIRVVPYFEGGTPLGFKLYGVKADSIVASLGIRNGDVVRAVNGIELKDPGDVFGAYRRLEDESAFVVDVLRSGKPETVRVEVR